MGWIAHRPGSPFAGLAMYWVGHVLDSQWSLLAMGCPGHVLYWSWPGLAIVLIVTAWAGPGLDMSCAGLAMA